MLRDLIAEIAIDDAGQLHVVPSRHAFPNIYREAMDVHWDPERGSLHSPPPRQWSCQRWFEQILAAARAQGCDLQVGPDTRWVNIEPGLHAELLQVARAGTSLDR